MEPEKSMGKSVYVLRIIKNFSKDYLLMSYFSMKFKDSSFCILLMLFEFIDFSSVKGIWEEVLKIILTIYPHY